MSFARSITASRSARIGAAVLISMAAIGSVAAPAQAHEAPKPGARCAMSGLTEYNHGTVYLCQKTGSAKPTWSKGLTESKSPLKLSDGWVKAVDSGMTASFGVISNPTGKAITIVGASSPLSAAVQLHEMAESNGTMVMQEKPGGIVVPAGGMATLKPGGNHVMLMKVKKPIKPGQLIPITLITSNGGLLTVKVIAKTYTGANETYDPNGTGMSGM